MDKLGEGAFGVVYQATAVGIGRVPKPRTVAVKRLRGKLLIFRTTSVVYIRQLLWALGECQNQGW